jgi:hypothetical protein
VRQYGRAASYAGTRAGGYSRGEGRPGRSSGGAGLRRYGLVILDELNVAVKTGVVTEEEALSLVAARPPDVELVGHGPLRHGSHAGGGGPRHGDAGDQALLSERRPGAGRA